MANRTGKRPRFRREIVIPFSSEDRPQSGFHYQTRRRKSPVMERAPPAPEEDGTRADPREGFRQPSRRDRGEHRSAHSRWTSPPEFFLSHPPNPGTRERLFLLADLGHISKETGSLLLIFPWRVSLVPGYPFGVLGLASPPGGLPGRKTRDYQAVAYRPQPRARQCDRECKEDDLRPRARECRGARGEKKGWKPPSVFV